jgi:hypothetical protein
MNTQTRMIPVLPGEGISGIMPLSMGYLSQGRAVEVLVICLLVYILTGRPRSEN